MQELQNTLKLRKKLATKEDSWTIIILFYLEVSNNISIVKLNDAVTCLKFQWSRVTFYSKKSF